MNFGWVKKGGTPCLKIDKKSIPIPSLFLNTDPAISNSWGGFARIS
jgi:hypothetical protein